MLDKKENYRNQVKSNNKFTLPYQLKVEDITLKEKDQIPDELIKMAKEEICKGMKTQANLKEVS